MQINGDYLFIYSETGRAFLNRARLFLNEILLTECHVEIRRTRFLYKNRLIPISLVLFERGSELGFCDYGRYQIGLSKKLIYAATDIEIKDILRHELAHLFTFLDFGPVSAHGSEFHFTVSRFFKNPEIAKAKISLNIVDKSPHKVIEKVIKLLALSSSSNTHEAILATAKANELLLKHNLELLEKERGPLQSDTYMKRVLIAKKSSAKLIAISKILESFYVTPILSRGNIDVALEVIGLESNVIFADYVAKFLDFELENLYRKSNLKGVAAKNSFMRGIADGFLSKLNEVTFDRSTLLPILKDLTLRTKEVYPRLGSHYSFAKTDESAKESGYLFGKRLSINQPINSSSSRFLLN